jgi:chromosome segregation ATPase
MHQTLRVLDLELTEMSDKGAQVIFGAIAQSPSMRKIIVRNNLIHDGLFVHKCIVTNRMIRKCNVEFNAIDYRLMVEIEKAIEANHRKWKEMERRRFQGLCRERNETQDKLAAVRRCIFEEREQINGMEETLARHREELQKVGDSKRDGLIKLETRLNDLIEQSSIVTNASREASSEVSRNLERLESDVNSLSNRLAREVETDSKEKRALANLEQRIVTAKTNITKDLGDLNVSMGHAVARYEDYKNNLIAAWQNAKFLAEAQAAEELEAQLAAPAPAGKKKGGKSKKKGKK